MSTSMSREVMDRLLEAEDWNGQALADDVIFTLHATGDTARGPGAVREMLEQLTHCAFDARTESRNMLLADGHGVWEGHLIGKQVGEFAGMPATGKDVCVPLCVVYDLEDGEIRRARMYLEMPVLRQ